MSATPATVTGSVPRVESPLDRRRWWPWTVAVGAMWIAVVHASLWWLDRSPVPRTLWGDETTYLASALRLLAGDPGWGPEPLWPPLYPRFVAGVLRLGGGSLTAVAVVQSLLLALTAVVLFDLVCRLTRSKAAGFVVAFATLGYPPLAAFAHYLWPEVLHLFLFVALLWLLAFRADRPLWCAVAGVTLGLAVLVKSLLLPFAPVLLAAAVWGTRPNRAIRTTAVVLIAAGATLAPTVVANADRPGCPMIAGSATFNLWVGLNDVGRESFRHDVVWPAYRQWVASADTHAARNRILRSRILELTREKGLAAVLRDQISKQYFRLFDVGCYLTDQLPGGAAPTLSGSGYLGVRPGVAAAVAAIAAASILLLYVTAPAGLILGDRRGNRWVRVLVVFVVYNLLLFFWLHVKTRYRIQLLPSAFVGVGLLVAWIEAGCRPRPTLARIAAAAILVALLLVLALG